MEVRGWCNVGSSITGIGVRSTINPFGKLLNIITDGSPSTTSIHATLSIKKYDNGNFSLRPISHVLYPIQGTVHLPQTNNVTEIHRVPSTIRSNFRSMFGVFGDDIRTSQETIGSQPVQVAHALAFTRNHPALRNKKHSTLKLLPSRRH